MYESYCLNAVDSSRDSLLCDPSLQKVEKLAQRLSKQLLYKSRCCQAFGFL